MLSALKLSASVDDSAFPSGACGRLLTTGGGSDEIYAITGPFARGSEVAAVTPCNDNKAPSTCPAPGFRPNYLGQINPNTGKVSALAVAGVPVAPNGLLWLTQ